jgi:hypothetical protein
LAKNSARQLTATFGTELGPTTGTIANDAPSSRGTAVFHASATVCPSELLFLAPRQFSVAATRPRPGRLVVGLEDNPPGALLN